MDDRHHRAAIDAPHERLRHAEPHRDELAVFLDESQREEIDVGAQPMEQVQDPIGSGRSRIMRGAGGARERQCTHGGGLSNEARASTHA